MFRTAAVSSSALLPVLLLSGENPILATSNGRAVALAWTVLREPLGSWQAADGIIVLVGVYLARRGDFRHRVIQEKTA